MAAKISNAFTLDGPTFASSVKQQMTEAMRLKGDVPDGIHFQAPAYYSNMTGHGELWVGKDGLPVRQILAPQFPENNNEAVSAHITVNFSRFGYARDATVANTAAGSTPDTRSNTARIISMLVSFGKTAKNLPSQLALVATILLAMLLMSVMVYYRRLRMIQQALSLDLIFSFVVGPSLSSTRMTRFLDVQTARAEAQEAAQEESKAVRDMRTGGDIAESAPAFDPHQNPLESAP